MGEIKKYEKLTMIILKDGETILTPMTVDEMEAIIAKREFIRVGDDIFHKYDIKRVKPYIVALPLNHIYPSHQPLTSNYS